MTWRPVAVAVLVAACCVPTVAHAATSCAAGGVCVITRDPSGSLVSSYRFGESGDPTRDAVVIEDFELNTTKVYNKTFPNSSVYKAYVDNSSEGNYVLGPGNVCDYRPDPADEQNPGQTERLTDGNPVTVIAIGPTPQSVDSPVAVAPDNCAGQSA